MPRTNKVEQTNTPRPVDVVINHVLSEIAQGHFAAGQRLTEADLISSCSVGTGPVREALRILSGEGVVEIVPNKGARVRKLPRKDLIDILHLMDGMMAKGILLSKGKLKDEAARQKLETAMGRIQQLAEQGRSFEFMQALGSYHIELNRITGNDYLNYIFNQSLLVHFSRELANTMRIEDWDRYLNLYRNIHENILKGKVEVAAKKFKEYIASLIEKLSATTSSIVF